MESTKLWSEVAIDAMSPLHKISSIPSCNRNQRHLRSRRKLSINEKITLAVNADFDGAVRGATDFFRSSSELFDASLLSNPSALLQRTLDTSIATSAAAFTELGI